MGGCDALVAQAPEGVEETAGEAVIAVEDGVFTYEANTVVLDRTERDRVFARAAEADPGWADYQAKTTRVIPVVAIEEVPGPRT